MDKTGKEGSFKPIFIILIISLLIASFWDKVEWIKSSVHYVLDPSAGSLLGWDITYGMIILIFIITLIMTLFQKYATDQEALKELKKEQKAFQNESKEYKEHPEKMAEMGPKQMELMGKMMKLSMRPMIYTGIPIILFFRWFMDYFNAMPDFRFFGFFTWFWFYLLGSILFSSVLRKVMKVA